MEEGRAHSGTESLPMTLVERESEKFSKDCKHGAPQDAKESRHRFLSVQCAARGRSGGRDSVA